MQKSLSIPVTLHATTTFLVTMVTTFYVAMVTTFLVTMVSIFHVVSRRVLVPSVALKPITNTGIH